MGSSCSNTFLDPSSDISPLASCVKDGSDFHGWSRIGLGRITYSGLHCLQQDGGTRIHAHARRRRGRVGGGWFSPSVVVRGWLECRLVWCLPLHSAHREEERQLRLMWFHRRHTKQRPFERSTCLLSSGLLTV